jgi:hypothetical protein
MTAAGPLGATSTTSTTYTTLTGPSVTATIPASGNALVILTARMSNSNGQRYLAMGFSVDGSAATDDRALILYSQTANVPVQASAALYVSGLSAGSHTFSANYYRTSANTGTFTNRQIMVIPMP